ncbi:MAG: DinB family protein [bacterium]|nr:DinB family protein [bacterium]
MSEPQQPIVPKHEIRELDAALDAFAELRRTHDALDRHAPGVSGWSCAQHLYHVALATDLALRNVQSLQTGKGLLIVHEGEPTELALRVLREGRYPRGESKAPRMVTPPDEVDRAFLDEEMERNRETVRGLRGNAGSIVAGKGRVPHQVLGPLDALQWLRFAQLHAHHHLAIVRDVAAALR